MSRISTLLRKLLLPLSLLYVATLIASFVLSHFLPLPLDLEMPESEKSGSCYWFFYGVQCGTNVFAGHFLQNFFNFWLVFNQVILLAGYGLVQMVANSERLAEFGQHPYTEIFALTLQSLVLLTPFFYLFWRVVGLIGKLSGRFLKG